MAKSLLKYELTESPQESNFPKQFTVSEIVVDLYAGRDVITGVRTSLELTNTITKVREILGFGRIGLHPSKLKLIIEAPNVSKAQVMILASMLGRRFNDYFGCDNFKGKLDPEFCLELKLKYCHISSNKAEYVVVTHMFTNDWDAILTVLRELDSIRKDPVSILLLPDNGP